jgi:hypothetical protein
MQVGEVQKQVRSLGMGMRDVDEVDSEGRNMWRIQAIKDSGYDNRMQSKPGAV